MIRPKWCHQWYKIYRNTAFRVPDVSFFCVATGYCALHTMSLRSVCYCWAINCAVAVLLVKLGLGLAGVQCGHTLLAYFCLKDQHRIPRTDSLSGFCVDPDAASLSELELWYIRLGYATSACASIIPLCWHRIKKKWYSTQRINYLALLLVTTS